MKYTKEDLMNTWGVVESKEHAEFIIELAEINDIPLIWGSSDSPIKSFKFRGGKLRLFELKASELSDINGLNQITIPLPPKEKEWPQVGDEVLICDKVNLLELSRFNGKECEVLGICSNGNDKVLTVKAKHQGVAAFNMGDWIKKPKTKQELLIEELHQKLLANNCSDEYLLACDIVQGKIEGLSYD